jgi:hypothetical protein
MAPKAIAGSYTINVVLGGNAATITQDTNSVQDMKTLKHPQ